MDICEAIFGVETMIVGWIEDLVFPDLRYGINQVSKVPVEKYGESGVSILPQV